MSNRYITLVLSALMTALCAPSSSAQQCPAVELSCSPRANDGAVHCVVRANGYVGPNLTYQWGVSVVAPILNQGGSPSQVEIDLSDYPHEPVKITVTVNKLPDECTNTASFVSNITEDDDKPSTSTSLKSVPTIIASCAQEITEGTAAFFNAQISDADPKPKAAFRWSVPHGSIKSGQGTSSILVDTTDLGNQIIRATVTIEGIDGVVPVSCATLVKAQPKAYKLGELKGKNLDDETDHLRRFGLRLKIGLDERAYILAYSKSRKAASEVSKRAERIKNYLVDECGIDPMRVVVVHGGVRKEETIELWIAQGGAVPPD